VLRRIIGLAVCVCVCVAGTARAQSFGRNKVHYDALDFRVLETPHFNVHYYPAEHDAAVQAGRLAERWYARLSAALHDEFTERQPIVLYASHAQFAQTNVVAGLLGEGVGGVTDQERGRVVLPFAPGLGETDHVLGHEIVHAFQRDILKKNNRAMNSLPLWFIEGMAEYLSIGGIDTNTSMWLRDAVAQDDLPRIADLDNPNYFPYRYGQSLWAYLAHTFGEDVVSKAMVSRAKGGASGRLAAVTGKSVYSLTEGWHAFIRERSHVEPHADDDKADEKRDVKDPAVKKPPKPIVSLANGGRLNVGPALSPDGRSLVFLSERDQYSIDVYVANTTTGAISRKLVATAGDPHFESLQFIESAGGWDPSGKRFALAALAGGLPVLSIFNVANGSLEREYPIHGTDQAFGPTWSPDGKRIAFSAMAGGLSDLYVLDLEKGSVQALTRDAFADLQPAWSPDGRTLAFATDRFSSSLETLRFGQFRLAQIDVQTAVITPLPSVSNAKNIDPHWSRDGANLFFIADADNISNVYRLNVASGEVRQVTSVATGVSGVTGLSPALSVAARSDRMAYTVYRHGGYEIHVSDVDASAPPAVTDIDTVTTHASPTVLMPAPAASFSERPYRAGLRLDRLVQPYLSAGGGSTGSFIRGGVGLSFADMLGNRQLDLAVQAGKQVDDFIAQATYLNMRSRWNWGVTGGQVPWLSGGLSSPLTPSGDGDTLTRKNDIYRQLHREVAGVAIYPFSGAKRVEFSAGVQSIAFDRESTTTVFSATTGQTVSSTTNTSPAAPTATLVDTGAALVYDTSVFGAASPILGQRYRFSIAPSFGSVSYTTVTADYRRYIMPLRPFTIAMRVMNVGRYGSGAGDPRLMPLAWTLRDIVRGYGDTGPNAESTTYLSADRLLVGNVELRFPIPGVLSKRMHWGALPMEGLVFSDAGRFWIPDVLNSRTNTAFLHSAGAGVRLVAAGVVFEFDAVKPLDQLAQGWTFSFNFRPGF